MNSDELKETIKQEPSTSGLNDRKRKAEQEPQQSKRSAVLEHNEDQEDDIGQDDNYVTMVDVLEEEQKLEEEAFALLGGSDDKNCTYVHGYVGRQAIYACKTCRVNTPETTDQVDISGVCLACSYACHEGHELYELYTKRHFRCDCGNSKMKNHHKCLLLANKSDTNELNKYNHNFFGRYCLCDRPYPDPDGVNETMIQCVVCEDWFHDLCLNTKFPKNDDFGELICGPCMDKHAFLWCYQEQVTHVNSKQDMSTQHESDKSAPVDVVTTDTCSASESKSNGNEHAGDSGIENSSDSVVGSNQCKLKLWHKHLDSNNKRKGTTFWEEGWRQQLCRCADCNVMYSQQGVEFLCDETDTVHYYEAKGKEKGAQISHYERGLNEINKMDRVQSIEAISKYNEMTSKFKEFLKSFAENNKIVRQSDIEEFFTNFKADKRRRELDSFSF